MAYMRVAVHGREDIRRYLRDAGYQIVQLGDGPYDALVYDGTGGFRLSFDYPPGPAGALLVSARGQGPQDVEEVLRRRCYTRLL